MKLLCHSTAAVLALASCAIAQDRPKELRLGLIGLDTSHVIAFNSRFNATAGPTHVPGGPVKAAFQG